MTGKSPTGRKTRKDARRPGRPSKYKPEYCQTVIAVGMEGGWLCEMAEACDVVRSQMDVWAAAHPEFSEALTRARQKAQCWFERMGREGLTAEKFNSALWQKQMSARHPNEYTEKRVIELPGDELDRLTEGQTAQVAENVLRATGQNTAARLRRESPSIDDEPAGSA